MEERGTAFSFILQVGSMGPWWFQFEMKLSPQHFELTSQMPLAIRLAISRKQLTCDLCFGEYDYILAAFAQGTIFVFILLSAGLLL